MMHVNWRMWRKSRFDSPEILRVDMWRAVNEFNKRHETQHLISGCTCDQVTAPVGHKESGLERFIYFQMDDWKPIQATNPVFYWFGVGSHKTKRFLQQAPPSTRSLFIHTEQQDGFKLCNNSELHRTGRYEGSAASVIGAKENDPVL